MDEKLIEEIVKQLPVKNAYDDAISPAAKQIGGLAEDLAKVVRLALFPVSAAAGLFDRYQRFVKRAVDRVPEHNRVSPAPQIAGPVLEGVRYEPEGTTIDEMFSNLLSSAMNVDKTTDIHPAFPGLIKQLSSDEAQLLRFLAKAGWPPPYVTKFSIHGQATHTIVEKNGLAAAPLAFPKKVEMYTAHLEKLGLIRIEFGEPMKPIFEGGKQTGGRHFNQVNFTDFGRSFMRSCLPTKEEPV